jgi:general secretion pathway protein D
MQLTCSVLLLSLAGAAYTQSSSPPAESPARVENGIPIAKLIAAVAKKTGKKFIIDPRVRADVELVGQDTASMSYGELLTVLRVHGFTAVEYGGYVNVIPDTVVRNTAIAVVSGKETRPDAEFVSTVISVKNIPAVQLVPLLRPMVPQAGHLVALPCVNKLILVDTFANIRRIETLIESLDVGEPYKPEKCEPHAFSEPRSASEAHSPS